MFKRLMTALVLIPLVLSLIFYASHEMFTVVIAIVAAVAFDEISRMFKQLNYERFLWAGASAVTVFVSNMGSGFEAFFLSSIIVFMGITVFAVIGDGEIEDKMEKLKINLMGYIYIALPLSCFPMLRNYKDDGLYWFLFAMIIPWICDSGAYFYGSKFGKHKMTVISPKKSWEGTIAGFFSAIIGGAAFSFIVFDGKYLLFSIVAAAVASTLGQIGDLAESLLKRAAGVKDSSNLFPGHGGMLDRIDSLLFSVLTLYFFLRVSGYAA